MLTYLHIENIAVIEKTNIELVGGFNVLTGETGAGKSIIIDSINAVTGERASRDLIRSGFDKASISALFTNPGRDVISKLGEYGLEPDEDGNILLQRTLNLDGKSVSRLNGSPITATILREFGRMLINIHGQHDSQFLLNPDKHFVFLDLLSGNEKALVEYTDAFNNFKSIKKVLTATQCDEAEKERQIDLLNYQIDELTSANIFVGEYDKLTEKRQFYQNYEKVVGYLTSAYNALYGMDDSSGALSLVQSAGSDATNAGEIINKANVLSERICSIGYDLEDVSDELRDIIEDIEYDPAELERIENRLDTLQRIMRKYGNSEEEMLEFLDKAQNNLNDIRFNNEKREHLEIELEKAKKLVIESARVVTETRVIAGEKLSESVMDSLKFLDMTGVKFITVIEPSPYSENGADRVEFKISTNSGEPPKPLSKIASGGELSRIMLAIKSVIADKDNVDTLVFDEIDTGISGHAAGQVGIQLKRVSKNRQVICVTHLAQIASLADNHLLIEKKVKNGRTYTSVRNIEDEDRVDEISRIISGGELTESIRNTAREMIEMQRINIDNF